MTISVVITCHNYGRFLRECLESVLAQERQPDEIVVVDDASTDTTPVVAAAYADYGVRYERVEYRNACQSYNHGIATTTGDLIAFVDADNALLPRFLGALGALMEADSSLGIAYSDRIWAGEPYNTGWAGLGITPGTVFRSYPPDLAMLVHFNFIDTMSIVRRAAVEAVGGFPDLPIFWDYKLWLAIIEASWQAKYLPEPLYYYRVHDSNMIVETRPQFRGCLLQIWREHFTKPFWAEYLRPEMALAATVLPGQQLAGGTPIHLSLKPLVTSTACPAKVTLRVPLMHGLAYLAGAVDWPKGTVIHEGEQVVITIPYPVPDGALIAQGPTVHLTLVARKTLDPCSLPITMTWEDCCERGYEQAEALALPALTVQPPLHLSLKPGGLQTVQGQFAPGESISVWATFPPSAPRPVVPLPDVTAAHDGTAIVDCRLVPQGFSAIILQGAVAGVQVVLMPPTITGTWEPRQLMRIGKRVSHTARTVIRQRKKSPQTP